MFTKLQNLFNLHLIMFNLNRKSYFRRFFLYHVFIYSVQLFYFISVRNNIRLSVEINSEGFSRVLAISLSLGDTAHRPKKIAESNDSSELELVSADSYF